jgi:outer membrane protein OmpA-like peptidoglycan-associated protein
MRIEIRGHTDNTGDPAANLELSKARANTVYQELVSNGIDAARLTATGYGDTIPIAGNDTEDGRSQNRRTEFKILTQ